MGHSKSKQHRYGDSHMFAPSKETSSFSSLVKGVDRGYAFAACGSLGRLGRLQALQAAPYQVSRLTP